MKLTRLAFICASLAIVTLGSVVSTSANAMRANGGPRIIVVTDGNGYRWTYVCDSDNVCVLQDVYWTG
jgi:hypothetical protein